MVNIPIHEMRNFMKAAYNNAAKWSAKVDTMPDDQIIVIFNRMRRSGKIKGV